MLSTVLTCCWFLTIVAGTTTLVVKQNYKGERGAGAWLRAKIHNRAHVDRVMWCSTLFVPRSGEVPRDVKDCHANALLHAQIYPGNEKDCRINGDELSVSPLAVHGLWRDRPADLVIHGTFDDGRRLEQVIRLHPLSHEIDEIIEQKDSAVGSVSPVSNGQPVGAAEPSGSATVASPPLGKAPDTMKQPTLQESEQDASSYEAAPAVDDLPAADRNPYFVLYAAGSIGVLVMALTIGMAVVRRKAVARISDSSKAPDYNSGMQYIFEGDDSTTTTIIDGLESEEPVVRMRKQQENLKILTEMGKGASPSFYANLQ